MLSAGRTKCPCVFLRSVATLFLLACAFLLGNHAVFAQSQLDVASWIDSRNHQEWRLLSLGARWQSANKICRDAKMRLPRIETLQDVHAHLINVSAGQKALEVSELVWSSDSWTEASPERPSAVAMSMRNGENTSVGKDNSLPVLCVRDLPGR
jgi:hypothetical protein